VAVEEEVHQWVVGRAAKRKCALPAGFESMPMKDYMRCLVPRGRLERMQLCDLLRDDQGGLAGEFLCDIEQTPNAGASLGVTVPSLNAHSEIWPYKFGRFAVKNEYFAMQGVDAYRRVSGRRPLSPLLRCWPKIDESDARLLAGNGLHAAVLAAWFAYVRGNARRLPKESPTNMLSLRSGEGEDDGGDEADAERRRSAVVSLAWQATTSLYLLPVVQAFMARRPHS